MRPSGKSQQQACREHPVQALAKGQDHGPAKKARSPGIRTPRLRTVQVTSELDQGWRDFSPGLSASSAIREPLIPIQEFLVSGYLSV